MKPSSTTQRHQGSEPFPGGTSLTHLKVYDTPAPDGLAGGSPHMHFACTETYLVVNGRGAVQTLSSQGFREVALRPGSVVWFTPGLVHRLINEDGNLELFVVMENAGLPEHGDSILTLPPRYLENEISYLQVASLDSAGPVKAARRTEAFLDHLRAGASEYLNRGRVFEITADPERERQCSQVRA